MLQDHFFYPPNPSQEKLARCAIIILFHFTGKLSISFPLFAFPPSNELNIFTRGVSRLSLLRLAPMLSSPLKQDSTYSLSSLSNPLMQELTYILSSLSNPFMQDSTYSLSSLSSPLMQESTFSLSSLSLCNHDFFFFILSPSFDLNLLEGEY